MKNRLLIWLLTGLVCYSCEYDYYPDLGEYTPSVVVNSFITPDSTITVSLLWSKEIGVAGDYIPVKGFSAKIYENEALIFEGSGLNDSIKTAYYPLTGARYRLEVSVPDYGVVRAETSIPKRPSALLKDMGVVGNPQGNGSYRHFLLNGITANDKTRSIMVRAMGFYENNTIKKSDYYYATNSYCDQFNAVADAFDSAIKGSSMGHSGYIRIPFSNTENVVPLNFSIENFRSKIDERVYIGLDDLGFPIYETLYHLLTHINIEVIAPSDEYDKYRKSAYQQGALGNISPPIFNIIVPVASNIENGVGIFAGYSSYIYKIELQHDEE